MKQNILQGIQIFISVVIVISILLQQRGTGVGSLFGGTNLSGGEFYRSRRGMERFLFYLTIVMTAFLVITSFAYLFI